MRKSIVQILIALFCLWHMFAVAVYSLPRSATDSLSVAVRDVLLPVVSPYILTTSEWQQWDIFAPDPLRRVTYYRLDVFANLHWQPLTLIRTGSYEWWRHALYFKLFINVFDADNGKDDAKKRLLQLLACDPFHLAAGTKVRLTKQSFVIPDPVQPQSSTWWREWQPTWQLTPDIESICSNSSS